MRDAWTERCPGLGVVPRTIAMLGCLLATAAAEGQAPVVLPPGVPPADVRFSPPRTLNSVFPFRQVSSAGEWEGRQRAIRRRILVAAGLWPMPARPPLAPVIHGLIDQGDYTVEKVSFESFPGHFVTGNLYRPAGPSLARAAGPDGRRPGVLCPHGHWKGGRFMDEGVAKAHAEIAIGAERFENAARSVLQARCIGLARLGCVVFHYDMLGNADSLQFPEHRHGPVDRLDGREPGSWGFAGFQATARLENNFGLQTFNGIRSLDFLSSLAGIDSARIGVTGASGGGTQTMVLSAVDDRVTAAFPCVMVSTAMQGGCTCENAALLRIGQGNIDIAAATAPRPLGLTAADDWTKNLAQEGYPDLERLFRLVGAADRIEAHFDIRFKHNYNSVSRGHCYRFFSRHFGLAAAAPEVEFDFHRLTAADLTVWDAAHPRPTGAAVGDDHERHLCRAWMEDSERSIAPLLAPADAAAATRRREILGDAIATLIGRGLPAAADVAFERGPAVAGPTGMAAVTGGMAANRRHGERIPTVILRPADWDGRVVIWAHPAGKNGLFAVAGPSGIAEPLPAVRGLLSRGMAVVGADLFGQGESTTGEPITGNPRQHAPGEVTKEADRWKLEPAYYYGYNDSLFARRVHDLLTLVAVVRADPDRPARNVAMVGEAGAGHWVAAAVAATQPWATPAPAIDRAVVVTAGFRFERLPDVWHADFLPGMVKYGDLAGLLALAAPTGLFIDDPDPALAGRVAAAAQGMDRGQLVVAAADGSGWTEFVAEMPAR